MWWRLGECWWTGCLLVLADLHCSCCVLGLKDWVLEEKKANGKILEGVWLNDWLQVRRFYEYGWVDSRERKSVPLPILQISNDEGTKLQQSWLILSSPAIHRYVVICCSDTVRIRRLLLSGRKKYNLDNENIVKMTSNQNDFIHQLELQVLKDVRRVIRLETWLQLFVPVWRLMSSFSDTRQF